MMESSNTLSSVAVVRTTTESPPPSKSKLTDCEEDSPTRVTNSNTSSETASLPDVEQQEQQEFISTSLARQLEFYFSPANLPRDTYLQTLQSLNDGYVPITIVANFAKIQAIYSGGEEEARIQAVVKAVTQHSRVLELVYISTVTNKKVTAKDENTILAVGPSTLPLQPSSSPLLVPVSPVPETPIQNTIILREVQENVKEEDVRGLFEGCPPLQEVRSDVANCWFVTLDTTSRDEMMNVMLDLREKKLMGEPVKARLKTAATPTNSFVNLDPAAIAFPAVHHVNSTTSTPPASPSRNRKKKGSKNRRRKNSNANKQQQQQQQAAPSSPSPTTPKKQEPPVAVVTKNAPPPPKLEEESHFPALATLAVDNIVDKVGVEKMSQKPSADGASTATTASSATSSTTTTPPVLPPAAGGYAAALLKAAPPFKTGETKSTTISSSSAANNNKKSDGLTSSASDKSSKQTKVPEKAEEPKETIAAIPMQWGSGRSFAQVLKKEEQSLS